MHEKAMEKSEPGSGLFQWIVGGLLAVIAVPAGAIYADMKGSMKEVADGLATFKIEVVSQLGDIKTETAASKGEVVKQLSDIKIDIAAFKGEVVKQLSDIKIDIAAFKGEIVKQLSDMKAEIGATNSRLDQVVDRLDRLRTR
jgi:hypothetical protein